MSDLAASSSFVRQELIAERAAPVKVTGFVGFVRSRLLNSPTNILLTLALLPPFAQIAPQLMDLTKHPEALQNPEAFKLPAFPVLLMNIINFWTFAVTAHIFRHAANVNLWVGFVIAFVAAGIMLFIGVVGGTFTGALFGVPAG